MTGRFLHTKSALQKIPVKRHSEVLRKAISGSEQEGEIACVFEFVFAQASSSGQLNLCKPKFLQKVFGDIHGE
jgi:hypothetical protein